MSENPKPIRTLPTTAAVAVAVALAAGTGIGVAVKPDKHVKRERPALVDVYDPVSSSHLNALSIVPRRIECPPVAPSITDAGIVDAGPACEPRDVLVGNATFAVPSNVPGDIDQDPRARGGVRKRLVRLDGELPPELAALVPQLAQATLQSFAQTWCGPEAPPHDFTCPQQFQGLQSTSLAWCKPESVGASATDAASLCFLGQVVGVVRPEPPPDSIARPHNPERSPDFRAGRQRPTNLAPASLMLSAQDTAVVQSLIDTKLLAAWCKGDALCPASPDAGVP